MGGYIRKERQSMLGRIMERLIDNLDTLQKDKEDFKKYFEEFISYWEKEAESLKNRELTEDDSGYIHLNFERSKLDLNGCGYYSNLFELRDDRKLSLIESKLMTSLAIARSNYRSKHKNIWERLVDSIGGIFNIFGKGNS